VPDLTLDDRGVCQYCRDWIEREHVRRVEATNLPWLYDRLRREGKGKEYDVLIGLSGGVDSSLCLHHLVENGVRPLCFSMDNGYNYPNADENVMRLVEGLKVRFLREVIELDTYKELQAAYIKSGLKNIEVPTDHILMALSYQLAERHGIRNVIGGGNHATEGIMPESYGYQARDLRQIEAIYRRFNGKRLVGLPTCSLPQYLRYRFLKGIKFVNLLDYYDYDREAAAKLLTEKYGYKPYGEKHCENVFTSWFQNYYLPTKWKLDKRKPHYSSLINSGQLTRKEALEALLTPPEYPKTGLEEKCLQYPKRDYKDYPNNEAIWKLLQWAYGKVK
jgi:hypothetical protein